MILIHIKGMLFKLSIIWNFFEILSEIKSRKYSSHYGMRMREYPIPILELIINNLFGRILRI